MSDTQRLQAALLALAPDNSNGQISPQDLRDMLVSAIPSTVYNAQHYIGGPPDGTTDNTTALDQMFADYKANGYDGQIYFPSCANAYVYSGSGWNGTHYNVAGAGWNESIISLGSGKVLMKPSVSVSGGWVRGLKFLNGAGAYKQTYTGVSGSDGVLWEKVLFKTYSTCAVGSLSSDCPSIRFRDCVFDGVSDTSIGVALKGDNSSGYVDGCLFKRNRYGLKLGNAGQLFRILNTDFLRFDVYVATPRTDIWLVPGVSGTNGPMIGYNKFGNENLNTADFRIICADEDATVTDFTDTPNSTSANTTARILGMNVTNNFYQGVTGTPPALIYSYVDDWDGGFVGPNYFVTPPSYVLEFLNSSAKTTTHTWFAGNAKNTGLMTFSNRSITSL